MLKISAALCATFVGAPALAGFATIDFSTEDDFLTPLVNGQEINSPGEFGILVDIYSSSPTDRLAIFDTSDPGPNDSGGDDDLLVNLGNALIIQNPSLTSQTGDIFDTPNDDAGGGNITVDLITPGEVGSIDLIDINGGGQQVTGFQRIYDVPSNWTLDIAGSGPDGFDTLSLLTTAPQLGEGGATATVTFNDPSYDQSALATISLDFAGSGAVDNIVINSLIPAPGAIALFAGAGFVGVRRRRA